MSLLTRYNHISRLQLNRNECVSRAVYCSSEVGSQAAVCLLSQQQIASKLKGKRWEKLQGWDENNCWAFTEFIRFSTSSPSVCVWEFAAVSIVICRNEMIKQALHAESGLGRSRTTRIVTILINNENSSTRVVNLRQFIGNSMLHGGWLNNKQWKFPTCRTLTIRSHQAKLFPFSPFISFFGKFFSSPLITQSLPNMIQLPVQ